jgi:hypothetical protein
MPEPPMSTPNPMPLVTLRAEGSFVVAMAAP